jgi:hypothetical protein
VYTWMAHEAAAELQVAEEKVKMEDAELKVVHKKFNDSETDTSSLPELYMAQATAA